MDLRRTLVPSRARLAAVTLVVMLASAPLGTAGPELEGVNAAAAEPPGVDQTGLDPVGHDPLVVRDVPYGERDGRPLVLDVYRSRDVHEGPALVLVHGGSWRRRSKEIWSSLAPRYAEAGYVVFAIDYRLAPPGGQTRFPEPSKDVVTALEWVRGHGSVYRADPGRVAIAGSSAGAHLALLAAGSERARPDAVVLYSAPVQLGRLHEEDVLRRSIENFVGCPPEACPTSYRKASGMRSVDTSTPPALVASSRSELIPRHQARALTRRLERVARPVVHVELGGSRHGMAVASQTLDETLAFLDEHL